MNLSVFPQLEKIVQVPQSLASQPSGTISILFWDLFCSGITEMIQQPPCKATCTQPFISSWPILNSHSVLKYFTTITSMKPKIK